MKFLALFAIFMVSIFPTQSKIYSKCEFVKTMLQHGFDKNQLGIWSCIAKHESNYDTKAINRQTGDYGILQISHLYWCNDGDQPGKGCGITCNSLLGDDIGLDLDCARKVFDETARFRGNGFTAWTTYGSCQGDVSQYVAGCL